MIPFRFGGSLGTVLDPATQLTVHPRCLGEARLVARDANAFNAAIAQAGGEEALGRWVAGRLLAQAQPVFEAAVAEKGLKRAIAEAHLLVRSTTERVDAVLASTGASVQIENLQVNLPPNDVDALKAAQAAPKKSGAIAPGTRVIARWTDGREFGATVRNFDGARYEIVWDGATESTFLTPDCVRPV